MDMKECLICAWLVDLKGPHCSSHLAYLQYVSRLWVSGVNETMSTMFDVPGSPDNGT